MNIESISWISTADQRPDEDILVLIAPKDDDVSVGRIEAGKWFDLSYCTPNFEISEPEYWAHMPGGPEVV